MVANDENPTNVNPLNPSILRIDFGSWCWNTDIAYTKAKWILDTSQASSYALLTPTNIGNAKLHPCYTGMWLIGNEPDLVSNPRILPNGFANQIVDIVDLVRARDSRAKFWIAGGTQLRPPFEDTWFPRVWGHLPDEYKKFIKGFHTHFYVDDPAKDLLRGYLKKYNAWRTQNAPGKEILLSEVGVARVDYDNPLMALYPNKVAQFCQTHNIWGWCWYSQSKDDGYMPLMNDEGLTPPGETFSAQNTNFL